MKHKAVPRLVMAALLTAALSTQANEFNWLGTSGSATYWKDANKWTNQPASVTLTVYQGGSVITLR
jgi:hypothetical protein